MPTIVMLHGANLKIQILKTTKTKFVQQQQQQLTIVKKKSQASQLTIIKTMHTD